MTKLSNANGYVYFISEGNGSIKIGVTNCIDKRIKELQTGNPNRLDCVFTLVTESMREAHKIEAMLHRKFAACRIREDGEWFDERTVMKWLKKPRLHVGDYSFRGLGSYWRYFWMSLPVLVGIGFAVATYLQYYPLNI